MSPGALDVGVARGHPFVGYGEGPPLVVVPGVNDPLLRAREQPWFDLVLAAYCRRQARTCAAAGAPRTVYYLSRPPDVPETIGEMADGYADALDALDAFGACDLLGISMGGFVALALTRRDDRVRSVSLGLAGGRLSRHGRESLSTWDRWAANGEWGRIYRAGVRAVVTGWRRQVARLSAAVFDAVRMPPTRDFRRTVAATLDFDATPWLGEVDAPALVVGGTADPFFTDAAFAETAAGLDARHVRLEGWGHDAVIEGGRHVDDAVADFLSE